MQEIKKVSNEDVTEVTESMIEELEEVVTPKSFIGVGYCKG